MPAAAALATALLLGAAGGAAAGWKVFLSDLPDLPSNARLWTVGRAPGITFLDRNGDILAYRGPRNGSRVAVSELPDYVPQAFLAAEDHRFYGHGPVDLRGLARAVVVNLREGSVVQGGSTLTQQLAKTILLTPDQTIKRKLQEAILAWRLEKALGKDGVLELYVNRVFFGANTYGIEAASQTYFGKTARELTLAEAALLAALPKAPSRLNPVRDPEAGLARSHRILERMRGEGWITAEAQAEALRAPPAIRPRSAEEAAFGYVFDLASQEAQARAGDMAPDLIVKLAVDPDLQRSAAAVVRSAVAREGGKVNAGQAALVALAPDGGVRALVGGTDYQASPFNRAVQARRQPGSAFKPIIYAAALDAGVRPGDTRYDGPIRLAGWAPQNYGGGYSGRVTVAAALARSINTVAVRLGMEAGLTRVGTLARRFGISGLPARPSPSVALGSYEVSLLELAGAYQVFQQDGRRVPPYLVDLVTDASGRVLYAHTAPGALQVYDPGNARMMVGMLQGVVRSGTGRPADIGRPAAGKTGTSQDWRDAWFVGFTPDWVCAVWVGNDDNRPMRKVTGGTLPATIWRRFMLGAHQGVPVHGFSVGAWGPRAPRPAAQRIAEAEPAPAPARPAAVRRRIERPSPEPARGREYADAAPPNRGEVIIYAPAGWTPPRDPRPVVQAPYAYAPPRYQAEQAWAPAPGYYYYVR